MYSTPAVLATGDDFLVLEHLPLSPLDDAPAVGAAVGRALGEIHATRYADSGLLAADLSLMQPFPREGYGGANPEPHVFVHPKIAGSEPVKSPIEGVLTPLYSDLGKSAAPQTSPSRLAAASKPSSNGHASTGSLDPDALVQAIDEPGQRKER